MNAQKCEACGKETENLVYDQFCIECEAEISRHYSGLNDFEDGEAFMFYKLLKTVDGKRNPHEIIGALASFIYIEGKRFDKRRTRYENHG